MARELTYAEAILEGTSQAMSCSDRVVLMGQLVDYPSGIFGTTTGLVDKFGLERVRDFPVAENLMTQTALGMALGGFRPLIVHQRLDFMIYSLDAIANWLSLWRFKSNGKSNVPVVIRAIVGKGWGQGPQHSKSLHSWFAHLPGLRVAIPATAYDAKGLLLESLLGETPTIIIEGRSLFSMKEEVPESMYRVRFGNAAIRRAGSDLTLVAIGMMVPIALRVAAALEKEGVDVEVLDLRTISPWDQTAVLNSVEKTGRLAVADPAWKSFGVAGEIITTIVERYRGEWKSRPIRFTHPDSHTPMSSALEKEYYPDEAGWVKQMREMVRG
ncbi:MAG: transketolase C-terminal domain-containing protein [Verrucomicrobiota bacterium]